MVSTRKKKCQNTRHFSRLDETLNDFVTGNITTVKTMANEALESQVNGHHEDFEKIVDSASQNQVIGIITDDKIRNAVASAVFAVENCMHDAILTAMKNVVIPWIEMAVRSITGSSGSGPNSIVQSPDRRDFARKIEKTPLRSASSWLDLKIEHNGIDGTPDNDNSKEGDFPGQDLLMTRERTLITGSKWFIVWRRDREFGNILSISKTFLNLKFILTRRSSNCMYRRKLRKSNHWIVQFNCS